MTSERRCWSTCFLYVVISTMLRICDNFPAPSANNSSQHPRSKPMPKFLLPEDFINARFVDVRGRLRRERILNDQKFHNKVSHSVKIIRTFSLRFKRHRRGSVVSLDADKWPLGRIPYELSTAYCIIVDLNSIISCIKLPN